MSTAGHMTVFFVSNAKMALQRCVIALGFLGTVQLVPDFQNRAEINTYPGHVSQSIRNDMKKMKIKNWTSCIQDRNNWKLYVEKAKTFNN
jgi:hypothetical protein